MSAAMSPARCPGPIRLKRRAAIVSRPEARNAPNASASWAFLVAPYQLSARRASVSATGADDWRRPYWALDPAMIEDAIARDQVHALPDALRQAQRHHAVLGLDPKAVVTRREVVDHHKAVLHADAVAAVAHIDAVAHLQQGNGVGGLLHGRPHVGQRETFAGQGVHDLAGRAAIGTQQPGPRVALRTARRHGHDVRQRAKPDRARGIGLEGGMLHFAEVAVLEIEGHGAVRPRPWRR